MMPLTGRSSDIHIEPNVGKKNVEVRYRVDGDCALYQVASVQLQGGLGFQDQDHVQPGTSRPAFTPGR